MQLFSLMFECFLTVHFTYVLTADYNPVYTLLSSGLGKFTAFDKFPNIF